MGRPIRVLAGRGQGRQQAEVDFAWCPFALRCVAPPREDAHDFPPQVLQKGRVRQRRGAARGSNFHDQLPWVRTDCHGPAADPVLEHGRQLEGQALGAIDPPPRRPLAWRANAGPVDDMPECALSVHREGLADPNLLHLRDCLRSVRGRCWAALGDDPGSKLGVLLDGHLDEDVTVAGFAWEAVADEPLAHEISDAETYVRRALSELLELGDDLCPRTVNPDLPRIL